MHFLPRSLFSPLGQRRPREPLLRRVQDVITRHEIESERLIGWAQLGLVVFFGVLYAAAPRPADATMAEPVPIALALYLLFTVGRLGLSYRILIPGWLLVLSMLLDVSLLLGLIWTFHIQYGQSAAFYLKIPTFAYVFVFIALRALRFDPRFVLSIGIFAAAGWLVLVFYALWDSGRGAITRSFVDYLSGNRILIGAEIDKIVAILVSTAILTLAIQRARRILVQAVSEEARTREIRRFLSRGVADAITGSAEMVEAGHAEEREAAIIFLDLRGFTRLSAKMEPRDVVALLVGFHKRIGPIIARHDGVIDKYLGDGVMATFGAVQRSGTAAADALRALDAVMAEARDWRDSLARTDGRTPPMLHGAVAGGPVVFATLGDEERLEYTVIGEAANLAAKLEKHNKVEGTRALTTCAIYDLACRQGYAPDHEPEVRPARRIAGVAEPLDLVVLAG